MGSFILVWFIFHFFSITEHSLRVYWHSTHFICDLVLIPLIKRPFPVVLHESYGIS